MMEKQVFPLINVADDHECTQPEPANKVDTRTAEERATASLANSLAAISKQIRRVENALESGSPYLGTTDRPVLFAELSSLRREKNSLLEKDSRLLERRNLLLIHEEREAKEAECEDERILQRVDSFSILIVVSTLITGFSIPALDQSRLGFTRTVMTLVFALEMFATIFFSVISFYAKQAFNYGSGKNHRTARFLYHVRWVTFSAQACYTIGILMFVGGILLEATHGYDTYWALIGIVPTFLLSIWCWVTSAFALIALRMGLWTHNLLLFDAEVDLVDKQRQTVIPAPTSFVEWLGEILNLGLSYSKHRYFWLPLTGFGARAVSHAQCSQG